MLGMGLFSMDNYEQFCKILDKACNIQVNGKINIKKNKKGKGDIKPWEQIKFERKCK